MPTTDRRARRLAIARRRPRPVRQGSDEWFRRLAKAFRRMEMYQIARRRERIAAQPRVGDTLYYRLPSGTYHIATVFRVGVDEERGIGFVLVKVSEPVTCRWRPGIVLQTTGGYGSWREAVRRAQRTEEGSAHE